VRVGEQRLDPQRAGRKKRQRQREKKEEEEEEDQDRSPGVVTGVCLFKYIIIYER